MGLRLFAGDESRVASSIGACWRLFVSPWCRWRAFFAIVVLFPPRLSCCGVGRAGSVRGLLCVC